MMETYTNLNDEQIMTLVVSGNCDALEVLYDRYAPMVLGVVTRIVQDRNMAEEVLQEAFWRVWDKADSFEQQRGSFSSWLFSIARRQAIDVTRRQKIRPQVARDEGEEKQMRLHPDQTQVDEVAWQAIQRQQVQEALDALSPEQYQVIELAYYQGMTRQEIAEYTGNPLGTIHTRARLGLQKLRVVLEAQGVEA
jgi:RNA polymerase sigma-70 factor (ECF subfamily)